jgi:hypothetical protein
MTLGHQWVIITQMKSLFAWTSLISGGHSLVEDRLFPFTLFALGFK